MDASPPRRLFALLKFLGSIRTNINRATMPAMDEAVLLPLEEGLAVLLHDLEATRRTLQLAEAEVRRLLADVLPRGVTELEGLGTLEPKGGTKRKDWDRQRATTRVVAVALARAGVLDADTGEVIDQWALEVAQAVVEALTTAARLEFRVGHPERADRPGLATLGLDAADYCTEEAGTATVVSRWVDLELEQADDAEVIRLDTLRTA